jgi:hypothetical protein
MPRAGELGCHIMGSSHEARDPRVERGMRTQLGVRMEALQGGADPVGWKVGFNLPAVQQQLGLDRPIAGFPDSSPPPGSSPTAAPGRWVRSPRSSTGLGPSRVWCPTTYGELFLAARGSRAGASLLPLQLDLHIAFLEHEIAFS